MGKFLVATYFMSYDQRVTFPRIAYSFVNINLILYEITKIEKVFYRKSRNRENKCLK